VHLGRRTLGRRRLSAQEERIARTESLFRDVNERIAESAERFAVDEAAFVCECADDSCTERVGATLEEYERVRADGTRFLLATGHEDTRVERVIERPRGRFTIAEKVNAAIARVVRRLDPRTETV
jgi:hypothetical protein